MCGITGFTNLTEDLDNTKYIDVLNKMTESLVKRGPDEDGYYYKKHCLLGHKRLIVVDKKRWKTTYDI